MCLAEAALAFLLLLLRFVRCVSSHAECFLRKRRVRVLLSVVESARDAFSLHVFLFFFLFLAEDAVAEAVESVLEAEKLSAETRERAKESE